MRKILLLTAAVLVLMSLSVVPAPADENSCCRIAAELCARSCSPCGIQFFNCPVVPPNACAPTCVCKLCRISSS